MVIARWVRARSSHMLLFIRKACAPAVTSIGDDDNPLKIS
jgi:hypothetical protein